MIRSLQNANWLDTMTYHQAMKDPVKKEYVQHRKSKNYLNEPPGYPVYRTFKIKDQWELAEYLETKIDSKPDGTLEWTQPTLT